METDTPTITIIGAGPAGAEAAWQAAQAGVRVILYEMRPKRMTPAHQTGAMAELVCSNSLGSNLPDRALGLLKNELRRMSSLIIACADRCAVPAGDALAVAREAFSAAVTEAVAEHRLIEVRRDEVKSLAIGTGPLIVATGPLTATPLAEAIRDLAGQDQLAFYDAMAPIVTAESIDMAVAWRGNRWDKSANQQISESAHRLCSPAPALICSSAGDYINCPLSRDEYFAFVEAVRAAEQIDLHGFEQDEAARRYFEACLPIEVLARRDPKALSFGPMTPMGLRDPRTGRRPWAVVQLRQDDAAGALYNLVGFQTNLTWGEQARILRTIPGLEHAEFVRFGQMHRNTFINSPALLRPTLQWHDRDELFVAGQITGTEGYVGSTASGLLAGVNAARQALSQPLLTLPPTTMAGALIRYITQPGGVGAARAFQPMKANFGLIPDLADPIGDKRLRHAAYADRALTDLERVLTSVSERYS